MLSAFSGQIITKIKGRWLLLLEIAAIPAIAFLFGAVLARIV